MDGGQAADTVLGRTMEAAAVPVVWTLCRA